MSEIQKWLEAIGLEQYSEALDANDIDVELLIKVDDQMLKDIGVASTGHRPRIRNAIAKLARTPVAEANLSPTTLPTTGTTAYLLNAAVHGMKFLRPPSSSSEKSDSCLSMRIAQRCGVTDSWHADNPKIACGG
jgi:hypothetical protein